MNTLISTITLVERNRYRVDSSAYPGISYWDFVVDGVSLYDTLGRSGDWVSTLLVKPVVPEEQRKAVRRLLGQDPGDVPGGRVSLYVCPECGDLGCGAVTAKIEVGSNEVRWSDFGYENTYEDRLPLEHVGALCFNRREYGSIFVEF